jgi:PKD repeat protein
LRPWTTLPASQVATNGVLTLPALTFTKAGTYPVKLTLSNGSTRYVKVKVNKG